MVLKKAEEEKETSKELGEKPVFIRVVAQLPTQEIRRIEYADKIETLVTIEEFLTAQANARSK